MYSHILSKDKELLINKGYKFVGEIDNHNKAPLYLFINDKSENFTKEELKLIFYINNISLSLLEIKDQ